ncbi:unnamed protein product [Pleuronectes platessa]|uniref:Uncharacterized protein n=1 Tax=Pleuronectes platessa TaxID=8262 RepID=A0A9N7VU65_PLEPL|nr:unnamed protein product [Pleuronectes platessa]
MQATGMTGEAGGGGVRADASRTVSTHLALHGQRPHHRRSHVEARFITTPLCLDRMGDEDLEPRRVGEEGGREGRGEEEGEGIRMYNTCNRIIGYSPNRRPLEEEVTGAEAAGIT